MKKIIILILGSIVAAISSAFGQDLNEVLKNYYQVMGTESRHEIQTMIVKGKIMQNTMELPFTTYYSRSGKYYLEVPIQGQLMKQAYDGQSAWMVAPWTGSLDPVDLGGVQLKSLRLQSDIDGMLVDWEKKGYTMTLEGTEDLEGTKVYKLKETDKDGDVFYHYIDADNYVLLMTKAVMNVQGSQLELESYFSNYKPAGKTLVAYNLESKMNGQIQSQITLDTVIFNQPVNDTIFIKPQVKPKQ
jgi:hypothetical protein